RDRNVTGVQTCALPISGHARFAQGPALEVELAGGGTQRVEAAHYVIATGSAPWAPPIEGLEEAGYLTSTTAMELEALPTSLLVRSEERRVGKAWRGRWR